MKIEPLLAKYPPKRPLTDLDAIVEDWHERFIIGPYAKRRDLVVDWCCQATCFDDAVHRACDSRNWLGKVHNHQSRVTQRSRDLFADLILRNITPLDIMSFDQLYDEMEKIIPSGIGPVTLYDVATRVAAYLKLEPESLYLHAGVREGWRALGMITYGKRIPRHKWPLPLQKLSADACEDFLCTYRGLFKPEMISK